jgi:hypothetical protein
MAGLFGSRRRGSAASDAQRAAAAALAAAQQATQSVDGVAQPRGLFGRSTAAAPVAEPEPAAMPAAQTNAAPQKAGGLDVLWKVLAGHSPGESRRIVQADLDSAAAARQAAAQQAELLGRLSPEERDLYMTDPKRWAELRMNQQAPYTLAQGAGRYGPGGQLQAYAPEVGVDGGYGYSSAPDGSINWGSQRGMSHTEAETGRHNKRLEDVSLGQLGVAQGRLGLGWAAHNARRAAGGYGTPGVGMGVIPDEAVEIDP